MQNISFKLKNFTVIFYSLTIGLVFLFDRSFVGIIIYGQQLGKLIVGASLVFSLVFMIMHIFRKNIVSVSKFSNSLTLFSFIVTTFFLSLIFHDTDLMSAYTFKSSSYIWVNSILFFSIIIFKNIESKEKLINIFIYPLMLIPFVHYFFSLFSLSFR